MKVAVDVTQLGLDKEVKKEIRKLRSRITALETSCETKNRKIQSLEYAAQSQKRTKELLSQLFDEMRDSFEAKETY